VQVIDHVDQLNEAEELLRRDPQESLRLAKVFLDTNTELALCLRARRIESRAHLHMGSYADGEAIGQASIVLAREAGERYEEAMAHNEVGVFRFVAQDYEGALGHYAAAEQLLQVVGSEADVCRIYLNLGNVYYRKDDVVNSLLFYERTLEISERTGDDLMLAKVLTNLTGFYAEYLQDQKTATEYARRGIALFERLNDKVGLAKAYMHLGIHAKDDRDYAEALKYFSKSLTLRAKFSEPDEFLSTMCELAQCYLLMGDEEQCRGVLLDAENTEAFKNNTGLGGHYLNGIWAHLYLHRGEHAKAIELWLTMLAYLRENGTSFLESEVIRNLAEAFATVERFEEATRYYQLLNNQVDEDARIGIERRLLVMNRRVEIAQLETQAEIERVRNVELAGAVERLEQLHEENSEYLAFMAHELKSPLNTIRAITQLFMEDKSLASDDRHALIVQVRSISTRMFDLINRVLDRAKGRQDEDGSTIDIAVIWKYLLDQLKLRAREKEISLTTSIMSEPALARIPESRLISIIENLVSNSIKFSEPHTTVTVTVRKLYTDGNAASPRLLLSVKDEGQGLSTEDMDRLFRPYQRLSASPTQGEDSTGLGLHIVRRDVERSGGRIWCESVAGQGSTFYVELPLIAAGKAV